MQYSLPPVSLLKDDLRDWSADHEKMGKGVTLSIEELLALKKLLMDIELLFQNGD